jgi:hypothetical protein
MSDNIAFHKFAMQIYFDSTLDIDVNTFICGSIIDILYENRIKSKTTSSEYKEISARRETGG